MSLVSSPSWRGPSANFPSLLLLTILFSADAKSTPEQILYVGIMGVAAALTGLGLYALWRSGRMTRVLDALDDTASQLRVRGALVILLIFATLAHRIRGRLTARGVRCRSGAPRGRPRRSSQHRDLPGQARCHWIRISHTGVLRRHRSPFNVDALFSHTSALELVPLLVVSILIVRGAPALLYRGHLGMRPAIAVGFLQAATLTFPVVVAEIGLSLGLLSQAAAAALIGAALLSVLIFPAVALVLRPWTVAARKSTVDPHSG